MNLETELKQIEINAETKESHESHRPTHRLSYRRRHRIHLQRSRSNGWQVQSRHQCDHRAHRFHLDTSGARRSRSLSKGWTMNIGTRSIAAVEISDHVHVPFLRVGR